MHTPTDAGGRQADQGHRYVPAAGRAALTPLYDRVMALTMRERQWRPQLSQAVLEAVEGGGVVVDVGCGTATQAIDLAARRPDLSVIGVDGDATVLALARAKPGAQELDLREGDATALPLGDESADVVICSLLLHHLAPNAKRAALREARRVLRTGGRLHIADWGRPDGSVGVAGFALLRLIDGREGTRDHAAGRLPSFVTGAHFEHVETTRRVRTVFGTLDLLSATAS
jgi:ubiquinone/menaquinone biosynthesis C-methylase UbiE